MKIAIVDKITNTLYKLKDKLLDIPKIEKVIFIDNEMDALNIVREDYEIFILNTALEGIDKQFIIYCINKNKKVIIYTDNRDLSLIERINNLKIVDYIIKSITPNALIDTVKRIINNQSHNILFFSNDKHSRPLILSHIESQNINVIEYKTLTLVIENINAKNFDILLLDFDDMDLEDLKLINSIRSHYLKNNMVVILFSYFNKNKSLVANSLKWGVNFIIYKPYLKEELINLLNDNLIRYEQCHLIDERNGLYKLDFFKESGKKMVHNALREKLPISLAVIEIDNLKAIIDRYKIDVNDIIKHLGNILINSLRSSDLICNYYDNKIAILMMNTEVKNAYIVINRIRKKIKHLPFILDNEEILNYTISGGISGNCKYDLNIMLDIADDYLYRKKRFGIDKIEIISEE